MLTERLGAFLASPQAVVLLAEARASDTDAAGGTKAEEPAGFASVALRPSPYYDGPIASLDELYVRPTLRDQGIGSKMIEALLTHARREGWGEIQVNVDEPDDDARRFYESHGFTNTEPGSEERMLCYLMELED